MTGREYRDYVLAECKRQWKENQEAKYGPWDDAPECFKQDYFDEMYSLLADNLTKIAAHEMEYAQIMLHSSIGTELYNVCGAQYVAQKPAQYKPQCTVDIPQDSAQKHYKDYIVPLTPRPQRGGDIPVDVYDCNGNYIATFASSKIASEKLNVNVGDIASCCKGIKSNGKRKYQAKGYIFRYAE
jgi:hypothetical protein